MRFGDIAVEEAAGAVLAHSLKLGAKRLKKGRVLTADDVALLREAGLATVVGARLAADDVPEDAAANRLARALLGPGLTASAAFTGRANLFAERPGVLVASREAVDAFNLVDEAVTLATIADHEVVEPKQMVATLKIIPFAVPEPVLARCEAVARERGPLLALEPFAPRRVALIQTTLPGVKPSVLDSTVATTRDRLAALSATLVGETRCPHETAALTAEIGKALATDADIVLVVGASAVVDRRDVIPAAIEAAGGVVEHFGMPVDPGNLMLLGRHGDRPVIGAPGCARSPKLNGFDWVLQRLAAGEPVDRVAVMRMGVGGLLKEIPTRPQPRARPAEERKAPRAARRIAALVLAAGQSRRMGAVNKLLEPVDGTPMVVRAVESALASKAAPVLVVTGHEGERVRAALSGRQVELVDNPAYAEGLSTSLRAGVAALAADIDGVVVLLGDMPRIAPAVIDRLIAAFDPEEGRVVCVPTRRGKRGNPVLFGRRIFPEIAEVKGDVGARHLIGQHEDVVVEVEMGDDGILLDVDTPEALARLLAGAPE